MSQTRIYIYECKSCNGKVTKPKCGTIKAGKEVKFVGLGKWFCEVERKVTSVKSSFKEEK